MAPEEREKCRPPRVTRGDVEAAGKKRERKARAEGPRQVTQGEGGSLNGVCVRKAIKGTE